MPFLHRHILSRQISGTRQWRVSSDKCLNDNGQNKSSLIFVLSLVACQHLKTHLFSKRLMYFPEQCLIELKTQHQAKQTLLKLSSFFNTDTDYINPASFAIPWNIPFLSSNSVEGASNSAILPWSNTRILRKDQNKKLYLFILKRYTHILQDKHYIISINEKKSFIHLSNLSISLIFSFLPIIIHDSI